MGHSKYVGFRWVQLEFQISCQKCRSKNLNLNCIYRIFYKNAKKEAPNYPRISISHNLNPFPGKKIHCRYIELRLIKGTQLI